MPDAAFSAFTQLATEWTNAFVRMIDGSPVPYAFAVGMLAALNPCGFVMLPGFAAFYVTAEESPAHDWLGTRLRRAIEMAVLTTATFIVSFTIVGIIVVAGGSVLMRAIGWAGAAVGLALIGMGTYQLVTRRSFVARFTPAVGVGYSRGARGAVVYGVAYAICSLGCALPTFLVVAGSVLVGNTGYAAAASRFVEYALGMGAVLTLVAASVALARDRGGRFLRGLMPAVEPVANALLVVVGLYVFWYWTGYGAT